MTVNLRRRVKPSHASDYPLLIEVVEASSAGLRL